MKRFTLYIAERVLNLLKARQEKTGVPVAEQIRRAIDEYLKRQQRREKGGKHGD